MALGIPFLSVKEAERQRLPVQILNFQWSHLQNDVLVVLRF